MELATSHWTFASSSKVLGALASNALAHRRARDLDNMSLVYRKTRLLTTSYNKLKYFAKVVVPEERTMDVAFEHHQITLKLKVLRELSKHGSRKIRRRIRLRDAQRRLVHGKKSRIFSSFISYAASVAIKYAQNRQAFDKRRFYLLRDAFTSLHLYTIRNTNLDLMLRKATQYHMNNSCKKAFTVLAQNSNNVQYERHLDVLCRDFIAKRSSIFDMQLSVFIALHKYAVKQKQEHEAVVLHRGNLLRQAFDQLQSGLQIQRNYQNQKTISDELYNQKVLQMAFSALVENIREELLDVRKCQQIMMKARLRRSFRGMRRAAA